MQGLFCTMRFLIILGLMGFSGVALGQGSLKTEFTAKGCCPMCEDRIIGALDVSGVRAAEWDQFEQKAIVVYKPKKISEERIQQLVAEAGHDTDRFTASDEAYGDLDACCLYRDGCSGCSEHQKSHEDHGQDDDHDDDHDDDDR